MGREGGSRSVCIVYSCENKTNKKRMPASLPGFAHPSSGISVPTPPGPIAAGEVAFPKAVCSLEGLVWATGEGRREKRQTAGEQQRPRGPGRVDGAWAEDSAGEEEVQQA